ncbi:MAG: helix-turn-helix domain-containing protein [Pseudomonadota bacterium]
MSCETKLELPMPPCEKPRVGTRQIWSALPEICATLRVAAPAQSDATFQHILLKAGQRLNVTGSPFSRLYIVNGGFLKTLLFDDNGNEQVLGFPMKGDVLGIDAIGQQHHTVEARTLSDCDLIIVPFRQITLIEREVPGMEQVISGVISRELVAKQKMIGMLSALPAEARVARFLLGLSERYGLIGFARNEFTLQMSRRDIGSHLALAPETISRILNAFKSLDLIDLHGKRVRILDGAALDKLRRFTPSSLQLVAGTRRRSNFTSAGTAAHC